MDAARTEIGRVQARPRDPLIEFHDALALLKAPEKRRHGAYVDRKGRDVQQVIGDPRQLGEEHADVLGASRSFDRSEEHTSELQSRPHLVCRLLLEKKK